MSDSVKSQTKPTLPETPLKEPVSFKFDITRATAKLDEIEKYLMEFAGKKGYNPYKSVEELITPLRNRLTIKSEQNETLWHEIQSLNKVEPKVS